MSLGYRTNDVRYVVAFQADVVFAVTGVVDNGPPGDIPANHISASPVGAQGMPLLDDSNTLRAINHRSRSPSAGTAGAAVFF